MVTVSKQRLKIWVFSLDLNISRETSDLRSTGSILYILGAVYEKDLSAKVTYFLWAVEKGTGQEFSHLPFFCNEANF